MEKLSINNTLTPQKLTSAIHTYTSTTLPTQILPSLLPKLKHKAPPKLLHESEALSLPFLENCIKACLSFQLDGLVPGVDGICEPGLLGDLRDFYFRMTWGVQGVWRDEFQFQRSIVCVVKIVGMFFAEGFGDVTVDGKLEAEIYVILVYIFMGVKVGTKSYQLLEKKYMKQPTSASPPASIESQKIKFLQKRQRRTFVKQSSSKDKDRLSQSFFNQTQPMLFSRISKIRKTQLIGLVPPTSPALSKSSSECFMDTLKEDLYVSPLPQIHREKKSIQSFFVEADTVELGDSNSKQKEKQKQRQREISRQKEQYRKFPFLSTQLSISMHSQIIQRHVSIAEHTKPFKIKHKMPYNSKHMIVFKNKISNENENSDLFNSSKEKQQERWKLSCEEWRETILGIKQNFIKKEDKGNGNGNGSGKERRGVREGELGENGVEGRRKGQGRELTLRESVMDSSPGKINEIFPIGVAKSAAKRLKNLTCHHENKQNSIRLEAGVKNFKQVIVNQNDNYFDHQKLEKVSKHVFREGRKKFNQEIKERDQRITYTMFMLPSMKNKKLTPS